MTRRVTSAALRRRELLRGAFAFAGAAAASHAVTASGLLVPSRSAHAEVGPRFLVLLRLAGGNDGLNTLVPWQSGAYRDARPTLAVPEEDVLVVDAETGFHPRMAELKAHFDAGRLAVVQGVGYEPASLSHFRSELIWQSADLDVAQPTGWIGRYLDGLAPPGGDVVRAVDVATSLAPLFASDHANVFAFPSLGDVDFPTDGARWEDEARKRDLFERLSQEPRTPGSAADFLARGGYVLSRNVDAYRAVGELPPATAARFPETGLARGLSNVARMIAAARNGDIAAGVFQVEAGGFDTHSDQDAEGGHADLLGSVSQALDAFHGALTDVGASGDVLVLGWSEFGRRVEENGSAGTDHGTAAPVLLFGDPVVGGLHGEAPDPAALDDDGNLRPSLDFRSVYREVLERWLPGGDPEAVLGADYAQHPLVGFLRS